MAILAPEISSKVIQKEANLRSGPESAVANRPSAQEMRAPSVDYNLSKMQWSTNSAPVWSRDQLASERQGLYCTGSRIDEMERKAPLTPTSKPEPHSPMVGVIKPGAEYPRYVFNDFRSVAQSLANEPSLSPENAILWKAISEAPQDNELSIPLLRATGKILSALSDSQGLTDVANGVRQGDVKLIVAGLDKFIELNSGAVEFKEARKCFKADEYGAGSLHLALGVSQVALLATTFGFAGAAKTAMQEGGKEAAKQLALSIARKQTSIQIGQTGAGTGMIVADMYKSPAGFGDNGSVLLISVALALASTRGALKAGVISAPVTEKVAMRATKTGEKVAQEAPVVSALTDQAVTSPSALITPQSPRPQTPAPQTMALQPPAQTATPPHPVTQPAVPQTAPSGNSATAPLPETTGQSMPGKGTPEVAAASPKAVNEANTAKNNAGESLVVGKDAPPFRKISMLSDGNMEGMIIELPDGTRRIFKENSIEGHASKASAAESFGVELGLGQHFAHLEQCKFPKMGPHGSTLKGGMQEIIDGKTFLDLGLDANAISAPCKLFDYLTANYDRLLNLPRGLTNIMKEHGTGIEKWIDNERALLDKGMTPQIWAELSKSPDFKSIFLNTNGAVAAGVEEFMSALKRMSENRVKEILKEKGIVETGYVRAVLRNRQDLLTEYAKLQQAAGALGGG